MKPSTLILLLLSFTFCSTDLRAGDVYAEYKMNGVGGKTYTSGMYYKNGDMRTEVKMDVSGKEMTSVTLYLKSNPDVSIVYNNQTTTYTEAKRNKSSSKSGEISITVLGSEKIGTYNCKHVRMSTDSSYWDMWVTKDLPYFDFRFQNDDEAANKKIMELMKSKSADGVPVKMVFFKAKTEIPAMTMELVKYETKDLDASLFKIPEGYTKNTVQFDAEKMKSMTPEERQEMIRKMMEQNMPKK